MSTIQMTMIPTVQMSPDVGVWCASLIMVNKYTAMTKTNNETGSVTKLYRYISILFIIIIGQMTVTGWGCIPEYI